MVQVLLVLLICLSIVGSSDLGATGEKDWMACAPSCHCVWSQGKKGAECASHALTAVPNYLSRDLQIINLNENNFHTLPARAFYDVGLVNLHKIFLRKAGIKRIDKDALWDLKVLIEIDLSENNLTFLPRDLFRSCEKIREVIVQKNPIHKLDEGLFTGLGYLQKVDFTNCHLTTVSMGTFVNVSALSTLELKGNRFKTMDLTIVHHIPKLKNLGLTDNPWNCDCHLRPLRDWVIKNKLLTVPTQCQNGQQWSMDLDFACKPEVVTVLQDGAFLGCLVSGDPLPAVQWYFNGKPINNHSYTGAEYLLHSDGGWFNLTVRHARGRDSGEYKCVAKNSGGEAERKVDARFASDDDMDGAFGAAGNMFDVWPLIVGIVLGALLLLTIVLIMCCCLCKKQQRVVNKKEVNGGLAPIDAAEEKNLMVNPVQKPPRRQETALDSSETELLPYNENGSINGTTLTDNQSTPGGTLGRARSRDSADPPDLLSFQTKAFGLLGSPGSRPSSLPQFGTLPYARSHSPFSPPMPVVPRSGYVTIPRRPRVPSWTASLSPVLVSPDDGVEPVYDNLGPRTTLTGSSVLSLNKMDVTPTAAYKTRPLPAAPVYEPINELRSSWARSIPDYGDEREMLITSSPHVSVAVTKKTPPNPPPKPKKKKSLFEDEGEDGTEV